MGGICRKDTINGKVASRASAYPSMPLNTEMENMYVDLGIGTRGKNGKFVVKPEFVLKEPGDFVFIDGLFFDNVPVDGFARPVDLPQHWDIARVLYGRIEIGPDEIEEGLEVGVTTVVGLLLSALIDFVQKGEDLLGCDGRKIAIVAKVVTQLGKRRTLGLDRSFFQNSSCVTPFRHEPPGRVSRLVSRLACRWVKADGDYERNVRYAVQLCKNPG